MAILSICNDNESCAVELIKIAEEGFKTSELPFGESLYPQVVFMLQQSLEKALKTIMMKLGLVSADELESRVGCQIIGGIGFARHRSLEK